MRNRLTAIGASLCLSCGAKTVDPPASRPLTCTEFSLDTELEAQLGPDTFLRKLVVAPDGTLFAHLLHTGPRWAVGTRRERWTFQSLPPSRYVEGLFVVGGRPWIHGHTREDGTTTPWLQRREGDAWIDVELPFGTVPLAIAGRETRLIMLGRTGASVGLFMRVDGAWTRVDPFETGTTAKALFAFGDAVFVAGETASGAPALAVHDGDQWSSVVLPSDASTIVDVSGPSLADLTLLGRGHDDLTKVWSLWGLGADSMLGFARSEPYAGIFAPRRGVAMLTPGAAHYRRLTIIDAKDGLSILPPLVAKEKILAVTGPFVARGDRTVHLLAEYPSDIFHHYVGTCE